MITIMKFLMAKYSKKEFEGFTYRFVVRFFVKDQSYSSTLQIYSNSDSYKELNDFISEKKSENVMSFVIEHRASKEQDEIVSKFIEETLNNYLTTQS